MSIVILLIAFVLVAALLEFGWNHLKDGVPKRIMHSAIKTVVFSVLSASVLFVFVQLF